MILDKTQDPLPPCDHWTIDIQQKNPTQLKNVNLNNLRQYWHKENEWCMQPPKPPFQIPPRWRIPTNKWKLFWKLPIIHKAFTPWWRMLHDNIGTRQKLAKWDNDKFGDDTCKICHHQAEDICHFTITCPRKWKVWQACLEDDDDADVQICAVENMATTLS